LTLFPVKHTSVLDRVVVDITSSRFPARAGLTALGAGLTTLDRNVAENLRSLPREGPRQGQRAYGCSKVDRLLRTP
jgi:hypothetical protein